LAGGIDLKKLLADLSPLLDSREYVFCTFKDSDYGDYAELKPIASFIEAEGLTLVMAKDTADKEGISYQGTYKRITLNIYSSLDAVGLTAAVSTLLAKQGISANMIAAYYHDHIFVKTDHAERALALLQSVQLASEG
jgi:uncharacterized protein